jgi:hypothetical protein
MKEPLWKNTIGLAKKLLEIIEKPFEYNIIYYCSNGFFVSSIVFFHKGAFVRMLLFNLVR